MHFVSGQRVTFVSCHGFSGMWTNPPPVIRGHVLEFWHENEGTPYSYPRIWIQPEEIVPFIEIDPSYVSSEGSI